MRVLITGSGGFLGRRLTSALLTCPLGARLTELVVADRASSPIPSDSRIRVEQGDLTDDAFIDRLAATRFDNIFHLAASLTLDAESDPAAAYEINVEATRQLVERAAKPGARVTFTSSIAVFGGDLPTTVDDKIRSTPTTTYGTHKLITELLLADETRRGRIDGRVLRLPILLTRPGGSLPTVSDRIGAILREPLAGRDVLCPLAPETEFPIASAGAVAAALLALNELDEMVLPATRAMNLPSLTVRVADIIVAIERRGATGHIRIAPDARLQRIVDGWPKRFVSAIGTHLGLRADVDIDAVIADHLKDREEQQ
jgi:nucleoside-diphosphate-sugar epimerase